MLADYAVLIKHLKETLDGAANCPIVAFGGSYGGTLSTFFRIRYPSTPVVFVLLVGMLLKFCII